LIFMEFTRHSILESVIRAWAKEHAAEGEGEGEGEGEKPRLTFLNVVCLRHADWEAGVVRGRAGLASAVSEMTAVGVKRPREAAAEPCDEEPTASKPRVGDVDTHA
jgi:hypothetical protein